MPDTEMRVRRSRRRFFEPIPTDLPDDVPLLAVEPAETDLGPLTPLVSREGLTDIFVNGPQDVWYEAAGTLLSLRLQPAERPSLRQLQERGMMGRELEQVLRQLVRSRANLLVSGGTGTGKTTLLGALLQEADAGERLLLVEDTSELRLEHPHTVSLQARAANAEGQGEVGLAELIRQALRMRPSRLVVGECRGAEVMDMLTAMNTGHSGSGTTVHANSAGSVPARLYAMGALAGVSSQAVALQAATALDYIVHLEREGKRRIVRGAYRLVGGQDLTVEPVCTVEPRRRGTYLRWHPGSEELQQAAGLPQTTGVGA